MEDVLTLEELYLLVDAKHESDHEQRRFLAAIQGIDLDEDKETDSAFDKVAIRAAADLAGMTQEEFVFDMIGIEIDTDDE